MIYETTTKTINVVPPGAIVDATGVSVNTVDRKGFDYAVFKVILGSTDSGLSELKIQESDDNSTWTDVPGLDFSVSPAVLPSASDSNDIFAFDIDLRGRKRYLRPAIIVGSGTNGTYLTVIADLGRADQTPHDAPSRGLAGLLEA